MVINIGLFCASRPSNDPRYTDAAYKFGQEVANRGWGLVYGGGDAGLMGAAADGALAAGGKVIGVIPPYLLEKEGDRKDLTEKYVVDTLSERKELIVEKSDAFVAMPGGVGTLDEFTEVWTWHVLGLHSKMVGLYNFDGYFNHLIKYFEHMVSKELTGADYMEALSISDNLDDLLNGLKLETLKNG